MIRNIHNISLLKGRFMMSPQWLTVLIIVFSLNVLHIIFSFIDAIAIEKGKRTNQGFHHQPCSYYNDDEQKCTHIFKIIISKVLKKDFNCGGHKQCNFYVCRDSENGDIERSSYLTILFNSTINNIPAITTLILTIFELSQTLNNN